MPIEKINRIMIAGTNSGCGKTTITCALIKAVMKQGIKTASFKCGPDYIDPMFHSEIIGVSSRNIDLFLCGEKPARYLFADKSKGHDISIIEGVMGFYDGMGGNTSRNSSYEISERFDIPVVLVVNCKGISLSVVALIKGYLDFYPNNIKAVVLNQVSKTIYPTYKAMIEEQLKIKVLGFMPKEPKAMLESRHLGLVTAGELDDLQDKLELLACNAAECIDIQGFLDLAKSAEPFCYESIELKPQSEVNIAVAKDKAFCFYYEDSLSLLTRLGARLIPFSPLSDEKLPEDIDGLILGGGYPELYLEQLSNNKTMRDSIYKASIEGLPIYAECGGYMYLGRKIMDYPMVGVIDMCCEMTNRLQNFGYVTLTADRDTLLLEKDGQTPAHEFHYSVSDNKEHVLSANKPNGRSWKGGYSTNNIFALYPHIHFWGDIHMAQQWIKKCEEYRNSKAIDINQG